LKYIQKIKPPNYFIEESNKLQLELKNSEGMAKIWNSLRCKKELKIYILENEQNGLCGYCEAKIRDIDKSHIEHIEAKSRNYIKLTFDYNNLIVSCNGLCFNNENQRLTCGHKKDSKGYKVNYNLFLNPTKIKNIRDYFIYSDKGFIGSSNLDIDSSKETMRVLNLNDLNNKLPQERIKSLSEFRIKIKQTSRKTGKNIKDITKFLLAKENLAFISFLQFKYKNI
jgi:uncharacterized protein (TIGR02646 family)